MRLSISNLAWDPIEDPSVAALLAAHGVDAIDVAPSKYFPDFAEANPSDLARVRRWWTDHGVEIIGMQALLFGTQGLNLFGDQSSREQMLNHLGHACRIAEGLGARFLVFGSPRNRDRSGLEEAAVMARARDFFRMLGEIAANHNTVVCLEPNPLAYGANFMTDSPSTAAVVRAVDHPAIRMQLDVGAMTVNEERASAVLEAEGALVAHIHVSEPGLALLGDCGTDHGPIASAIRRHCQDRIVTIEMLADEDGRTERVDRALAFASRWYGDGETR